MKRCMLPTTAWSIPLGTASDMSLWAKATA